MTPWSCLIFNLFVIKDSMWSVRFCDSDCSFVTVTQLLTATFQELLFIQLFIDYPWFIVLLFLVNPEWLEECMMDLIVNLRFQLPFSSCNASSSKFRQIMKKKFRNEYISLCRKLWICWWPMLTFRYKKWKLLFAKVVLCFNQ